METATGSLDATHLAGSERGLTVCSRGARWRTLVRPFAWFGVYWLAATRGWLPIALLVFPFLFVSQVVALNDLMHSALGVSTRVNELLIATVGLLVFESGHAIRASHLAHHQQGGGSDDPESYVDLVTGARLVREVPLYRFRVWSWALRHDQRDRALMIAEMAIGSVATCAAVVLVTQCAAFAMYVGLSTLACWTFPIVSARGPQTGWGRNRASHALVVRGRVLPKLLLNLTYHVEHHLFPTVPSYRLPELAARLETAFDDAGAKRIEVW